MKKERIVEVTQYITVTIDESKFDAKFLEDFCRSFYEFDTIDEHVEHLAQLYARGLVGMFDPFIEGYGRASDMGIEFDYTPGYAIDMEIIE